MMSNDGSEHWPRFEKEIKLLDDLRGEDFWATFPELRGARGNT